MRLINADCLATMDDLITEGLKIDLVLCDLPYGATKNKWDSIIDIEALWVRWKQLLKPKGVVILFGQDKFTAKMMLSNEKWHRYNLIWQKTTPTGFLNAKRMPLRTHEDIMVFYKELPTYNPQKTTGHKRKVSKAEHKINCVKTTNYGEHDLHTYDSTERYPTSVLRFKSDKQKCSLHPTQKPVALCEWLIKTYTNEGDIVLDNCMGSGTAGVAAENLNRSFIGIELNEKYFGIARERIEAICESEYKKGGVESALDGGIYVPCAKILS